MADAQLRSDKGGLLWPLIFLIFVVSLFLLQLHYVHKKQRLNSNEQEIHPSQKTIIAPQTDLEITSTPPGAFVRFNAIVQGKTPLRLSKLTPGSVHLEISLDGYKPYVDKSFIIQAGKQHVNIPLASLPPGELLLSSSPSGALLTINGKPHGRTPQKIRSISSQLLHLNLQKKCFQPIEQTIRLALGQKRSLHLPLVAKCGTLQLNTTPLGANIFINGQQKGKTPLTLSMVPQGQIELVVKKNGYADMHKKIIIKANQTSKEALFFPPPLSPKAGSHWQESLTGIDFVWVDGGCYQMGNLQSATLRKKIRYQHEHKMKTFFANIFSTVADNKDEGEGPECDIDESPVHKVCLGGFWLAATETTNSQFKLFSHETGIKPEWQQESNKYNLKNGSSKYYQQLGGTAIADGKHPVVGISWLDAKKFVQWFTAKTGYQAALPTEAQWEYSCRSGGGDEKFSGDTLADNVGWYVDNSDNSAHNVKELAANKLGLYDLSGNVWEWTLDSYDPDAYEHHAEQSPLNTIIPAGEEKRQVVRGGSWRSKAESLRCTARYGLPPTERNAFLGFRILMTGEKK